MKNLLLQLYALVGLFAAVVALLTLPSCATPQDTERLQRIGDIALTYAERTGKISPEDAALAREAGQLLVTKDSSSTLPVTVVVTSGK
jgi:hypothetical protein